MDRKLRWGICGGGLMSFDIANMLALVPERHTVTAVAARQLASAEELAKQFNIPKAYGSYRELAQDPEVDVVHVATVNNTHLEVCKMFLEAGKPVVCEKVLCCGSHQATELIEVARKHRVFFMEGVWTRYLPAYVKLRELLSGNVIGPVQAVQTTLLIDRTSVERITEKDIGGGVTWFTGVYALGLIDMVFPDAPLERVHAVGAAKNGVDTNIIATIQYSENRFASLFHSATIDGNRAAGQATAFVYGDNGQIELSDVFVSPSRLIVRRRENGQTVTEKFEFDCPLGPLKPNYYASGGLIHQADHVRECLSKGLLESPLMSLATSLRIQNISDRIRADLGLQPLEALRL